MACSQQLPFISEVPYTPPSWRKAESMRRYFSFMWVLVVAATVMAQEKASQSFEDDLLDHLLGTWDVAGMVHGNPSKQTLQAEGVLHHQFLRVYEKSRENVAQTNVPYEGVLFIGYDSTDKHYVTHLMNVFGGRDSETLGYGERKGNEIKFVFKAPDGSVEEQFIWEADSKAWHLVSWANTPDGKRIPILDLKATAAK